MNQPDQLRIFFPEENFLEVLLVTSKEVVMLEFYVESGYRLRQLRECATGDFMDPFAEWLESAGFKRRSAQLILRGAAHLGEWAAIG